jgi:hypothetical protein
MEITQTNHDEETRRIATDIAQKVVRLGIVTDEVAQLTAPLQVAGCSTIEQILKSPYPCGLAKTRFLFSPRFFTRQRNVPHLSTGLPTSFPRGCPHLRFSILLRAWM